MQTKTAEIEINTSDKELISDLRSAKITGLTVAQRVFVCDSADFIPAAETLITIIISSSSTVALSLLSSWLYDRFKNKKPDKTIINNTNIVNNLENVTVVINNSIKIIQDNNNK